MAPENPSPAYSRYWALACVLAVCACAKTSESPARPRSSGPAAAVSSSAPATPAAESAPEPPSPSQSEVSALIARWTEAQNTNAFPAYERLYAPKFTGIKRAGRSSARYGRAQWMADRKTMIAPGLTVEVSDVKTALSPIGARITFLQHYRSPRFEDEGTKQLFVIATPEGPRIQSEEMLTSTVAAHALPGQTLAIGAADEGGVYLATDLTSDALQGEPWLTRREKLGGSAEGRIKEGILSPDQRAIVGRAFTTYDATGKPCPAVVKSLTLRASVVAWVDTAESRAGYVDDSKTASSKARTTFQLGGTYLYGAFEKPCPGSVWALQGSSTRVVGKHDSVPNRDALVKAFRALPGYRTIDTLSRQREPGRRHWEDGAETSVLATFHLDGASPRSFLSVRVTQMCGEFDATLTAVFDVTDPLNPRSRGILDPEIYDGKNVIAAMDSDGDGELEFVSGPDGFRQEYSLLRRGKNGIYTAEVFYYVRDLICPC